MSNRISEAFAKGKAFIPFITCGDPSLEITEQLVYAMEEAGADLIELGIPFSDPTAEGPVIQEANVRALSGGVTTDKIFDMVVKIRKKTSIPMVFMTYANVVFSYGTERFIRKAAEIGMDGLILPDVPFEEKEEFDVVCKQYGLELISLIAPTSHDRITRIAKEANGFVYCVSSLGVTGTRTRITTDIGAMVKLVKDAKDIPCAVGFGISTPEQAKIAEEAGACAVMALERIPADIRAAGGVSRMSDPGMIRGIQEAVSIPVMAKCRIGHFVEAQILEAIEIDYIDESEVLSPADDVYHIDKTRFNVPFVCGARDLGEALRRIAEGASMIRTKGEPGTGDVVQAVTHMRAMNAEIRRVQNLREDELYEAAKQLAVPVELVQYVHENGRLPVVNFAAGGVATPADAALMMQLGAEGVFVGSGIFKSGDPAKRAAAIVKAVTNYTDAKLIAELSTNLGEAMVGINENEIALLMAERGK